MAALPKPHRIAFLLPDVKIEGPDGAYHREASVLLWTACIETCQRHPRLAVLDPEATPLFPQDGHFAPEYAGRGGRPTDAFYGPTRRDEVLWLELLVSSRSGVVRLYAIGRDGTQETFDALGAKLGEQIQQVLGAWLTARGLGPLPRRFEAVTASDVLATLRIIAPTLAEQARIWTLPVASTPTWSLAIVEDETDEPAQSIEDKGRDEDRSDDADHSDEDYDGGGTVVGDNNDGGDDGGGTILGDNNDLSSEEDDDELAALDRAFDRATGGGTETGRTAALDTAPEAALEPEPAPVPVIARTNDATLDLELASAAAKSRRSSSRPLVNRLPLVLRVPALRLLELALREDLSDAILAVDPEHPQALFARVQGPAASRRGHKDVGTVRTIIANAPGWSRPYAELASIERRDDLDDRLPSDLESTAAAGMAAVCRPGALHVLEALADRLAAEGRVDEGVRLLERGVELHDEDPRAHLALLELHAATDREGAWLEQALGSSSQHGCPMDPVLPWYPDQIHIDLRAATALMSVGRIDEAIALRANRLEGREASWPHHTGILSQWRRDPRFVAWSYAREGYYRGDEARAVEGFGRIEPADAVDLSIFLDSLVALGREDECPLAWAHFGVGHGFQGASARLAAVRGLFAAGDWRTGIELMWRVALTEPGRDEQVALARCGLLLGAAPLDELEAALAERIANGATTLAGRLARDIADFVPGAENSKLVARALGKQPIISFDPTWLAGFAAETRSRRAIDELFSLRAGDGNELVERWLEVVFAGAGEEDHAALAQAGAYLAAQALARYLAATTQPPSTYAGALRAAAAGALAFVSRYRRALGARDARAVLGAIEPLLRRADRWVTTTWLGTVERSLGLDERSAGDVTGFARDYPTVAARILGPEETIVLTWSVARLHRERPDGWAAKVAVQASRLATHTGYAGADEWADAIVAQLSARELDQDDAIDALHSACYLAEGTSPVPAVHLARALFTAGRGPAAISVLCAGLPAADDRQRGPAIASLLDSWKRSGTDIPLAFEKVAAGMFEALQNGDPARAEKLGRWAVACDPSNGEAHRNLGLALAAQGKVPDALGHLVRVTPLQATQILSGVLYQSGKAAEAMTVLDYASRWYVRADQWLTYGGIAYAATDNPRAVRAYGLAYQLDPDAFDATQLNAYAGVLDEVGDYETCETIANHLLRASSDDLAWMTNAWNHLACAYIGQGKFDEAKDLAERAIAKNPNLDNRDAFATTLERARTQTQTTPTLAALSAARERVFELLEAGDHAAAAEQTSDVSWRARRGAMHAARFRYSSENQVHVTSRARAAALAVLADTGATTDRDALLARTLALQVREQAYFARDPVPRMGDRMTRESFYQEFRARGGVIVGEPTAAPAAFVDREVVPGSKVASASQYIALLRDLAALPPHEALARHELDESTYLDLARAWAAAMEADSSIARTIATGL